MSRCQPPASPDQLDLIQWAQRWSHKRERWVAHHTLMRPELYGVEELGHETAFAFLRTHHYARNPAPAASRYGLYRSQGGVLKPELVGVVTFGPGGGERVLNAWTARDHTQALEALTAPLKAAREAQGLSQREVGEALGIAPSAAQGAIARWENGLREPNASNLAAWAAALGMTLEIVPKK